MSDNAAFKLKVISFTKNANNCAASRNLELVRNWFEIGRRNNSYYKIFQD